MGEFSGNASSSKQNAGVGIVPKVEDLTYDSPPDHTYSARIEGDNVASSSVSNLRSSFIGMGFAPSLVDNAIKENGEGNADLILETLFSYSRSSSSDSLDDLFDAEEETYSHANQNLDAFVKEEPDVHSVSSEKTATLVGMSFSKAEVESAINKLGVDAPINDLVDFIFAARMADKYEKGGSDPTLRNTRNAQQCSTEALFGTMEKTLKLFEMGFSEQQISIAIDKYGSEVPISELAAAIVAAEDGADIKVEQNFPSSLSLYNLMAGNCSSIDPFLVKAEPEDCNLDDSPSGDFNFLEKLKGKRSKEKNVDAPECLKRPKEEYDEDLSISGIPTWLQDDQRNSASLSGLHARKARKKVHIAEPQGAFGATKMTMPKSCKTHSKMVAEPPYFFYGSAASLNHDSWFKISQFLYSVQPEFVNTQSFSALSRQEGYVHNIPTENRFEVLPKSPMSIEEALPRTGKWWPSWDTRKHLCCIRCETKGIPQACERIGRILDNSGGVPSVTQQGELLQQLETLNLVWVGQNKVAPIQPEDVERILGYPVHHTRSAGLSLEERLALLKSCFQVDTLAFHLSALKSLFPQGLTLLSMYSGIGGAEVALHKLGIQFKVVVSVEPSESSRRILKQWWEKEGIISGELVQIESIQSRLGTAKLEGLINKYHGFDLIIGQTPPKTGNPTGVDFQLFYEYVRAVQRVRTAMGKSR